MDWRVGLTERAELDWEHENLSGTFFARPQKILFLFGSPRDFLGPKEPREHKPGSCASTSPIGKLMALNLPTRLATIFRMAKNWKRGPESDKTVRFGLSEINLAPFPLKQNPP